VITAAAHADLTRAVDALRAAYDRELAAGHEHRAVLINDLVIRVYRAAIIEIPSEDGGGQ
jgi:hypothetical protein